MPTVLGLLVFLLPFVLWLRQTITSYAAENIVALHI
jgi:hypothetical protein